MMMLSWHPSKCTVMLMKCCRFLMVLMSLMLGLIMGVCVVGVSTRSGVNLMTYYIWRCSVSYKK